MSAMRISQLAERTGVPATTLRFYETAGLLPAARTSAGYRRYGDEAVERLAFIGAAKRMGLALEEIAEVLAVRDTGRCRDVKADLGPRLAARLAAAGEQAAELTVFTRTLGAALERLDALPERAGPCDAECGGGLDAGPRPGPGPGSGPSGNARARTAPPVACSLTGEQTDARVTAWHRALDGARRHVLDGGLRLTVPVSRTSAVAGLAAAEQRCCPFFDFRLHLDGHELHLEVRAPEAGAELLAELFSVPSRAGDSAEHGPMNGS